MVGGGSGPALLAARALVYAYAGGARAVDGVDLAVSGGELVAVLGPNGSGKSTLLRLLAGLLAPDHGGVSLDGRPLDLWSVRERARRIAVVPQYLPALLAVTAETFVAGGRYAHQGLLGSRGARDRAAVADAMAEADVAELGERLLSELSGGQRQRVLVARALAQEAAVLLLDEPAASLDPEHAVRLFALVAELVGRGKAAVVATHELSLASQFATRIALVDRGRVAAAGAPGEVLVREVLEPVYGRNLWYGAAEGGRPIVVPWRRAEDGRGAAGAAQGSRGPRPTSRG